MQDLLYKIGKTDTDMEDLLAKNKGLVYRMLTNMGQLRNQDAESAAWEALWDALSTFDVFCTTAFSTYACRIIINRINDVLRKQQLTVESMCIDMIYLDVNLATVDLDQDEVCAATTTRVDAAFHKYVTTKRNATRDVLLLWRSSDFDMTVSNLAKACGCSPSYVSRVQCGFRAFLSAELKRL